jgi:3-oxoacyl-[acyl-carrier-protein] synthase-1/3-oxoacyl-[acyl-carrier-protein] synthase II
MNDVQQRAFITGVGIISPAGRGIEQTLETLRGGASAIRPLALFTPAKEPLPAGEVSELPAEGERPRTHLLALTVAREAMGGDPRAPDAVVLGGTTGGMPRTEELLKAGDREADHYHLHGIGTVADLVAREVGCTGPALTVSTACSSGAAALKIGLELIRSGRARRVLAGGADALCRLTYYGFGMLKLIDPEGARPLDKNRVGMTVGEAAAMVLLVAGDGDGDSPPEGALAELAGGGLSCDAHHPSAPHPEGLGAVRAMSEALSDAALAPGDVDYVNLHGTGTIDNDAAESKAMVQLFEQLPPLSSTKGAVGHSLAAAGAVEAVFCALCLEHGLIPANTGCTEVDPGLGLSPVLEPREGDLKVVLSNSFGFGGNNASLVLRRPEVSGLTRTGSSESRLQRLEVLGSACIGGAGHTADCEARFRRGEPFVGVLDAQEVARDLPRRSLRRLKRISRLTLALAAAARADGGEHDPDKVFYGTGWGALSETHDFLDKLFASGEEFSSPTDFVGSVHNAVAGQVAIRYKAMGANVTATGGDASFEQALLLASLLLSRSDRRPSLLIGSDEAQPTLTPLFDPSSARAPDLSDGGGALLVRPLGADSGTAGPTLIPRFFEAAAGNPEVIERLLAALGGPSALTEAFGAVLCGIPAGSLDLARDQRARLLAASGFSGPVIDYRRYTGEYAAASAAATVLAVRLVSGGTIPAGLAGEEQALEGRCILMLGLGQQVTAIEVGAPRA